MEAYAKAQGFWNVPDAPARRYAEVIELDLSSVGRSLAGPSRPHDRIPLEGVQERFRAVCDERELDRGKTVELELAGEVHALTHGALAIAAVTSCTTATDPRMMLACGLVAKKAAEAGLAPKPWVKTVLAPGSKATELLLERAGLMEGLRALGFRLNGAKRALCRDGQQKRVTGLVVNERVAVPACRRRRLRQELYFCRSRGVEEHLRAAGLAEGREQCLRRLLGQVDFWLQAQPDSQEAAEYRRWLLAEMRDKR